MEVSIHGNILYIILKQQEQRRHLISYLGLGIFGLGHRNNSLHMFNYIDAYKL